MLLQRFYDQTFDDINSGMSTNPVLHSFQYMVNRYHIDHELIKAFLKNMGMDISKMTCKQDNYQESVYSSVEVVGLMCKHVFYHQEPDAHEKLKHPARKLGETFQKVNFLCDMKPDWYDRCRVNFPDCGFRKLYRSRQSSHTRINRP